MIEDIYKLQRIWMTVHASLPQEIKGCTIIQKHRFYACTLYCTSINLNLQFWDVICITIQVLHTNAWANAHKFYFLIRVGQKKHRMVNADVRWDEMFLVLEKLAKLLIMVN